MNIGVFDFIIQPDSFSGQFEISVIAKSGTDIMQIGFDYDTIIPEVISVNTDYKFYSTSIKCYSKSSFCVLDSNNNVLYGLYPYDIDALTRKSKIVLFEKFDNYLQLVDSNSNIAVGSEFVGYLGIKTGLNEDQKSVSVNVSIILYDLTTYNNQNNFKAV